jgi:hypothetical protein
MPSIFSGLFKTFSPGGALHKKLIAGSVTNHESVVASAKAVDALDIQRIIPLHGVCCNATSTIVSDVFPATGRDRDRCPREMEDSLCCLSLTEEYRLATRLATTIYR